MIAVRRFAFAVVLVFTSAPPASAADMQGSLSVLGLDRASGAIGVAVVSDAPSCGAAIPWVEAGVGAIATQGEVNPSWGPRGLALLRAGVPPQAVCDTLYRNDPGYLRRMLRAGGFEILQTDHLFYFPRLLRTLRPLERHLTKLPLGAQYQVLARRPPAATPLG